MVLARTLPAIGVALCCLLGALSLRPAAAHEFILRPERVRAAAGEAVPVSVLSAHVFMRGEELEPVEEVAVAVLENGRRRPVALSTDRAGLRHTGTVTAPSSGPFLVLGTRLPQVWSLTPEGLRRGTPAELPGATRPMRVEKFAKLLMNGGAEDTVFGTVVGDRLEIVPLGNPALVRPGEDLRVRVLFDGQPLTAQVLATYDGFTDAPNSYAYFTETDSDGVARVRVSRSGLWMVRVERRAAERAAGHEVYLARAVLVFDVP